MMPREHVLVVEDDASLRELLRLTLEERGYRVRTAETGEAALNALGSGERPCLILLDLAMPTMDGWAFLQRARREPFMAGIPIVVLSGKLLGPSRDAALQVDGYIRKPVRPEELFEQIERFCKVSRKLRLFAGSKKPTPAS